MAACGENHTPPRPTATPSRPTATPSPTSVTPSVTPLSTPSPAVSPSPTPPSEASATPTPPQTTTTYQVQPGDTLFSIARRFGISVDGIVAANNITDPSQIEVGQVLVIPAGPIPTSTPLAGYAQVVRKGEPNEKTVFLTFDAGADAGFTTQILDTLKANDIVAGLSVTGRWAEQNPELLRRIAQEGQTLINHSYDHPSFTGLSTSKPPLTQAERWKQLDKTEAIVKGLAGVSTRPYFRPPYGDYDESVNADLYARGYTYNLMWTVDSLGWNGLAAEAIVERCLSLAEPGAIYVFHVASASQDAAALQDIIDGLREMGYAFGSVPALVP